MLNIIYICVLYVFFLNVILYFFTFHISKASYDLLPNNHQQYKQKLKNQISKRQIVASTRVVSNSSVYYCSMFTKL